MGSEWQSMSLGFAGVTLIDCDHRTPPEVPNGLPYVAIPQMKSGRIDLDDARRISEKDFEEWTQKADPRPHDVVLSRRCNPGVTAHVPEGARFALGQNLVLLRADGTRVLPRFLRWLVSGPGWWDQIAKFINVGAVFESLRCADVPKFELSVPPLDEQRRIAAVLGALDDKIELNRKMNRTLEAMAQALFKSWFIDFDGHDDLVDSELGPIPRGWKVSTVGQEFQLTMGQSPPGSTYNESGAGLPLYQGATDFGFRFPTPRVFCSAPTRLANAGDTLVSVRAPVGTTNMASEICCVGRGVAALRHISGSASYTYSVARNLSTSFDVFNAEGTVFGSINKSDFGKLAVVAPPAESVSRFTGSVGALDDRIGLNERQSRTLTALRDTLLPKLISGEIRVSEAEVVVEVAL